MAELIDNFTLTQSQDLKSELKKKPTQMILTFCWAIYWNLNSAVAYNLWG